ncbi:hypothetical protein THAOC_00411 [Thalassiosira oceanica]|uniref:Uncharacterized protein n=1 Tax=Thalassiosira oceanica TaxID=159749 RepID=K0TGB0_THAOC|nr:hypothetical protein THAOC_00411 [Thalassiosira oceanica]|eukprot:EJK77738.1 hypothetical protein THAOC_00411 [Thalassiosira oceanica]
MNILLAPTSPDDAAALLRLGGGCDDHVGGRQQSVRASSFTTKLAGRFYQNGSLERHSLRKCRLVEMQARKRRLEKELLLEERRLELLAERLGDTERARDEAHELIVTLEHGLVSFQAYARRRQARRLFRTLHHRACMRRFSAAFVQRRYRGWKGRARSGLIRQQLHERRRDAAASAIQAKVRGRIQRGYYLDLLSEKRRLSNESAVAIQAILRGRVSRSAYLAEMGRRHGAAAEIQRVCRGKAARVLAERMREELRRKELEARQPKRVPLHLRKYSTYGGSGRSQNSNKSSGGRRHLPHNRRRSSDAMIFVRDGGRLDSLLGEREATSEAGSTCGASMDSTLSSSTNTAAAAAALGRVRRTRASQRSQRSGTFNGGGGGRPSWPSAQRVLAARQQNAERRHTTLARPPRRPLERRRTFASGTASTAAATSTRDSTRVTSRQNKGVPRAEEANEAVPDEEECQNDEDKADNTGGVVTNSAASSGPTGPLHEATTGGNSDEKEDVPIMTREITISREAMLLAREVIALGLCAFDSAFDENCTETVDDLR